VWPRFWRPTKIATVREHCCTRGARTRLMGHVVGDCAVPARACSPRGSAAVTTLLGALTAVWGSDLSSSSASLVPTPRQLEVTLTVHVDDVAVR
jgi:hypothetical protein